jgi:hypothetical protein
MKNKEFKEERESEQNNNSLKGTREINKKLIK